jgi:hypothetical protein
MSLENILYVLLVWLIFFLGLACAFLWEFICDTCGKVSVHTKCGGCNDL